MTGKGILDGMQGRDKKDREKAAKKATRIARAEKAKKAEATRAKQSTSGLITPVRLHPRVRFQFTGIPTRILRSVTRSIPRLNYSLPHSLSYTLTRRTSQILNPSHFLLPPTANTAPAPLRLTQYRKKSQIPLSWVNLFPGGYAPLNRLWHPPSVASIRLHQFLRLCLCSCLRVFVWAGGGCLFDILYCNPLHAARWAEPPP